MKDQFLNDLKQELDLVPEIGTLNRRFAEYKEIAIGKKTYLVGKTKDKSTLFDNFKNYDLLFSLLGLIDGPLPSYFNSPHLVDVIPKEKIINLCREYGLPFEDQLLWKNHQMAGFELDDFRYRVAFLRSYFLLFKSIAENDKKYINLNMSLVGIMPSWYPNIPQALAATKESLAHYITSRGEGFALQLEYDSNNDRYIFRTRAETLLDIAYFQLATLLTSEFGKFGRNIKMCGYCHSFFLGHGNRLYCKACNRHTIWSRRHKSEKGGER